MISPRDIDTNVEVVESRAVESSTWLERGRKPAQTRYAISFVRAQTETRQLISRLLDKISGWFFHGRIPYRFAVLHFKFRRNRTRIVKVRTIFWKTLLDVRSQEKYLIFLDNHRYLTYSSRLFNRSCVSPISDWEEWNIKKGWKGGRKKVDGRFEETRDKFWNSRMKTKDESRLIIRTIKLDSMLVYI